MMMFWNVFVDWLSHKLGVLNFLFCFVLFCFVLFCFVSLWISNGSCFVLDLAQ